MSMMFALNRLLWMSLMCIAPTLTCLSNGFSSSKEKEYYQLYSKLKNTIVTSQNNSYPSNLQVLADAFFPKRRLEPICVIIRYAFLCNNTQELELEGQVANSTINCSRRYLWTEYALPVNIGLLMLSSSQSAFSLKGFDWKRLCLVENDFEIMLQMPIQGYNESLLDDCLGDLTSQLKAYADAGAIPRVGSVYRGYAINWNNREHDISLHDRIFMAQIVFLNIFILFFALALSNYLYQNLFDHIYDIANHHTINPGYPLYWGIVVLSIIWNVGPSWFVIYSCEKVTYSLAILILLLLPVAMTVKKKPDFPIPGFKSVGCLRHTEDKHSFISVKCMSCTLRHVMQVLSTWSLLVTFAFFMHYSTTIVMAFYLNPLGSLVKILFIKTVMISLIYIVALLFTIDRFECTRSAAKKNAISLIAIIAILSALPIVGYLIYVVGETIFIDSSHNSRWQSILIIIPPTLFLFVSWYSRGLFFPKNLTKPKEEIDHHLEASASSQDSKSLKADPDKETMSLTADHSCVRRYDK